MKKTIAKSSLRFKGSDCEFCIPLRVVNWTCHLGLLEIRGEIQYVVNNWKYDVKLSKNSILKKEYCKGITIFLCIIIMISSFLTKKGKNVNNAVVCTLCTNFMQAYFYFSQLPLNI